MAETRQLPDEVARFALDCTYEICALLQAIVDNAPHEFAEDQRPLVIRGLAMRAAKLNDFTMAALGDDMSHDPAELRRRQRDVFGAPLSGDPEAGRPSEPSAPQPVLPAREPAAPAVSDAAGRAYFIVSRAGVSIDASDVALQAMRDHVDAIDRADVRVAFLAVEACSNKMAKALRDAEAELERAGHG